MPKASGISVFALMLTIGFSGPVQAVAAPCTTTVPPGGDIQAAIDAASPGDVICLSPGLYLPPTTINVTKPVTIQGPQAGVDPRPSVFSLRVPGDLATEAVVDGRGALSTIIRVAASSVTLDGFEVRNGTGDLIDSRLLSPAGPNFSGVVLGYLIVHGSSGDEGVQLRDCAGCVIEFNHAFDTRQDGINMCCDSAHGSVRLNEVHESQTENAAIYVYNSTAMTIECNLVYDAVSPTGDQAAGIQLGSRDRTDVNGTGGLISRNVVHDTQGDGITVFIDGTAVQGNEVFRSSSEDGAIFVGDPFEQPGTLIGDITITNNRVHDNILVDAGPRVPAGITVGPGSDAATVTVNFNNVFRNRPNGVTNDASAVLDAQDNWWGHPSGPMHSSNPGGLGDAVSDNVDFTPWLVEPVADPAPCPSPAGTVGKVTGGGRIDPDGDGQTSSFGFEIAFEDGDEAPRGTLVYRDPEAGVRIVATSFDLLVVGRDCTHAKFTGTAEVNGVEESLEVDVDDADEPGSGEDTFSIKTESYSSSGPLVGGNIQIHRCP